MDFDSVIVITGIPRSGTTVIGEVLSISDNVDFIYEPFNKISGLNFIDEYFEIHNDSASHSQYDEFIGKLKKGNLQFKRKYYPEDPPHKKIAKKIGFTRNNLSYLKCKYISKPKNIIIKDPFLYFQKKAASEKSKIIVTERNYHQISASFKRMKWKFDLHSLNNRLKQAGHKYLDDEVFCKFDIETPYINGALLNKLACMNREESDNILYVNMNDLIENQEENYKKIFEFLGLEYTYKVQEYIEKISSGKEDIQKIKHAHSKTRDVRSIIHYWKKILTREEIDVVTEIESL